MNLCENIFMGQQHKTIDDHIRINHVGTFCIKTKYSVKKGLWTSKISFILNPQVKYKVIFFEDLVYKSFRFLILCGDISGGDTTLYRSSRYVGAWQIVFLIITQDLFRGFVKQNYENTMQKLFMFGCPHMRYGIYIKLS